MDVSPFNYSRYVDRTLDELYQKQSRTTDPEERRRYLREFEKRLLDDEAHYIFTFQWHRIVPHSARVRDWTITPSHFLNNQLDTGMAHRGGASAAGGAGFDNLRLKIPAARKGLSFQGIEVV